MAEVAERTKNADRMRAKRRDERDIAIPRVAEPDRRKRCLADIYEFLPTYFPHVFYQPFTQDRREMIDAIMHAARYGGDQAVAGPRADGKTRSALFCALALCLAGHVTFPMIISKSGPRANRELKNLKDCLSSPENAAFCDDFPEIAVPILALGRWSSRARQQTVQGSYTNLEWGEECVIFPTISTVLLRSQPKGWNEDLESAARGQIIASLGIEGPIRGYSVRNLRPDLAILDDLDDRESAKSETQTENRESIVEQDVGGLAGPDKTVSRVMLCTLINRTCIAATFTDRTKKPSWRGQRHKLLLKMPDKMDLWEEYTSLRQNRGTDDPDARFAHQFYLAHRAEMDFGAVVTNPYRFDARLLLDGEPSEASALQACFNLIADRGQVHFDTEYQNDPPAETGPVESGITPARIQKQLNEFPEGVVPRGCNVLTVGIDVGKYWLHYVVRAWDVNASGHTIHYGEAPVHNTVKGIDDAAMDRSITFAIKALIGQLRDNSKGQGLVDYRKPDGELVPLDLILVDAGYRTEAVYAACSQLGTGVYPIMGFGKSSGCAQIKFTPARVANDDTQVGDGQTYKIVRKGSPGAKVWLVEADVDKWKAWEHDRWMTGHDEPGALYLWGERGADNKMSADEKRHGQYAHHICNEVEIEEPYKDGIRRGWKKKPGENHKLDASVYADVAGRIKGIKLPGTTKDPKPRRTLAEMAKAAMGAA